MSYTVLRARTVTSRKQSQCTGCLGRFPAGTRMERITAVMDGEMQFWSYCPTCREVLRRDMEDGDEFGLGDLLAEAPDRWEEIRAEIGAPSGRHTETPRGQAPGADAPGTSPGAS